MFITAVCVLFFIKLRWPNNKSLYIIIIIVSTITVFAGVLFVHQPGANHPPGASVTQVNHYYYYYYYYYCIVDFQDTDIRIENVT